MSSELFQRFKPVCVPLLASSSLSPEAIPKVSRHLADLLAILQQAKTANVALGSALIAYIFLPLSTLLQRNASSSIPDGILESVFLALEILCEEWWWDCDVAVWGQLFVLCGAVAGDNLDKGKQRIDATKEAAVRCLLQLMRPRPTSEQANGRLSQLQSYARGPNFIPVIGRTIDAVLPQTERESRSLQLAALETMDVIICFYVPDEMVPTILPGIVSTTTKVALGMKSHKTHADGDVVERSLTLMHSAIVKSAGDEVCIREGAVEIVQDLEDLININTEDRPSFVTSSGMPYSTARTPAWLRGTATQLHMALNTLSPLVHHPNPLALRSLAAFSSQLLSETSQSLPQSQLLLLSFLLSLSTSDLESVSKCSYRYLEQLFALRSQVRQTLVQLMLQIASDNLTSLPHLVLSQADSKVEHAAKKVEAICRLALRDDDHGPRLDIVGKGIAKLLGPAGGVERWGWRLLSVLQFQDPHISFLSTTSVLLKLETDEESFNWHAFPELTVRNVSSRSAYNALVRMLNAMGSASGENGLYSVEWFSSIGLRNEDEEGVASLWCACRLFEGISDVYLLDALSGATSKRSKRVEKLARRLSREISELWDSLDSPIESGNPSHKATPDEKSNDVTVQHVKGVTRLDENLKISRSAPSQQHRRTLQSSLHRSLLLQLLSLCAGSLQSKVDTLFIRIFYPILHSLVSTSSQVSSTALASLHYITVQTSYASPANLLMSNFDYALDAVSRRLSKQWLDVDAPKVLAMLVRLVGSDIVDKAGDVVEECFDRLDEYHGYNSFVEGLMAVLTEVISVIKTETDFVKPEEASSFSDRLNEELGSDEEQFKELLRWARERAKGGDNEANNQYEFAPRRAWGKAPRTDQDEDNQNSTMDPDEEPPLLPSQILAKQIVFRSSYFLTHGSPVIRAKVLEVLASSVSILSSSALMPSIHAVWPFILNRLSDKEAFVVAAAAFLVETLSTEMGRLMYRRIWDDVWPRFQIILSHLDLSDSQNALSRRGPTGVGTETAYSHSHRLYRSVIKTMTAVSKYVDPQEVSMWQAILSFRRFLSSAAHEELQLCARNLYAAIGLKDADSVWLALTSTFSDDLHQLVFLRNSHWDGHHNMQMVFQDLDAV